MNAPTTQDTNGATASAPTQTAAIVAARPSPPQTDNDDASRALNAFASASNFSAAQRMAQALSASTIIPSSYQGANNLPNCLIALEVAARIGASVFMVMQNLDIIYGRPGWRSTFLIATVNASRRFTPLRYEWEGKRGTDEWGCRAVAKDRESDEPCRGALITWGIAKAEGWVDRKGSKWNTIPEQMFMYRAAAFWTRVYAPELSLGMQTSEEISDVGDAGEPPATLGAATANARAIEETLMAKPAPPIVEVVAKVQTSTAASSPQTSAAPAEERRPSTPTPADDVPPGVDWDAEAEQMIEHVRDAFGGPEPTRAKQSACKAMIITWMVKAPPAAANLVIRAWNTSSGEKMDLIPEGGAS